MASATVRVFEVLYHVPDDHPSAHGGAAGDGSFIFRTRDEAEATRFASNQRYYGARVKVEAIDAPRKLAKRWGLA